MEKSTKPVILITEPTDYCKAALAVYESFGTVVLGSTDQHTLLQQLSSTTIAVVRLKLQFDASLLEKYGSCLQCIVSPTTGLNHIDTTVAAEKNIQIISLQGESAFLESIPSTAEFTWGLILAACKEIVAAATHTAEGNWNRDLFKGHNLRGKTLGIIGLGRVGKQVAHFAHAFGMHVLAFDNQQIKNYQPYISMQDSPEALVSQSDIVTIHIPSAHNNHFIDHAILSQSKKGTIWINTSRANVWNEDDVVSLMNSGHLGAVATDVLSHENTNKELTSNQLWIAAESNKQIIIKPHLAGASYESMEATELFVAEKCRVLYSYNGTGYN